MRSKFEQFKVFSKLGMLVAMVERRGIRKDGTVDIDIARKYLKIISNKESNQQFTHLLNKKSNALYNLQVFVRNIPKHGANISIEETNKIIEKLLILINEETEASSAFYGSIEYASMKSLK